MIGFNLFIFLIICLFSRGLRFFIVSYLSFKFGDTFWKQINGTAMGTSCAVNYAFLYLALLEMVVLMQEFKTWMLFYGRFIDDGFGLWDTQKEGSSAAWEAFLARLNDWGDLKWTTTGHV